jgi:PIN domain nuclease of toxin-antitoxin system
LIVLDTHALLWWVNGDGDLSDNANLAIKNELSSDNGAILVSAMSAWEIAMLVSANRLMLAMPLDNWFEAASSIDKVSFVAVEAQIAVESTRLPGEFHKDPADRMIVALARHLNVPLVTADAKILAYKHVKSIW